MQNRPDPAVKIRITDGRIDQFTRFIQASYMKLFGHETDEADNGRDAIRQMQRSGYDIVITDSEIIGIDGPELCKFIKSHYQDIYIIGISGYPSALKDLEDAGADICFSKPFSLDELKIILEVPR
jgi:CheY-like chemotaxis protein